MQGDKEGEYMTTQEVADLLGLTKGRVRALARAGKLHGTRHGRDWLFIRDQVQDFARQPRPTGRPPKK